MSQNGYDVYLGGMRWPVTPEKIDIKMKSKNKTLVLVNDGEINFIKQPGLAEISVDFLLPAFPGYPFAKYPENFLPPKFYLHILEQLKVNPTDKKRATTQFIVSRIMPRLYPLHHTNIKVTVEDYEIKESHDEGNDVIVSVQLKQYRDFSTKTVKVSFPEPDKPTASVTDTRSQSSAPKGKAYPIAKNDTMEISASKNQTWGSTYAQDSLAKVREVGESGISSGVSSGGRLGGGSSAPGSVTNISIGAFDFIK